MNLFIFCLSLTFLTFTICGSPPPINYYSALQEVKNDYNEIFSFEELQFAFKNLKNIVDVIVERLNKKLNKVKLSGNINCVGDLCKSIPFGSIVTLYIQDTSRQDAPAINLATKQMSNIENFPFKYEIEYEKVNSKFGRFSIRVDIRKNDILYYTTDTHFSIIDDKFQPIKNVNLTVIGTQLTSTIPKSVSMPGGLNEIKPADSLVKSYVNQLKDKISKYLNNHLQQYTTQFENLEAISYRSQVVAGKIYFIKVKADDNYGHLHVRVFVPLPFYGKDPELAGIHWGPFSLDDPIDYIKSNENMSEDFEDEDEN